MDQLTVSTLLRCSDDEACRILIAFNTKVCNNCGVILMNIANLKHDFYFLHVLSNIYLCILCLNK